MDGGEGERGKEGKGGGLECSVFHSSSDTFAAGEVTSDADSASDEDSAMESADEAEMTGARPTLQVGGGFQWDLERSVAEPQSSSDSEEEEVDISEVRGEILGISVMYYAVS